MRLLRSSGRERCSASDATERRQRWNSMQLAVTKTWRRPDVVNSRRTRIDSSSDWHYSDNFLRPYLNGSDVWPMTVSVIELTNAREV
jgi:hypothetical protein